MSVIETKTFKSGNSVAVRLPRELGIAAGTPVTIEKSGAGLRIVPVLSKAEILERNRRMVDALRALPPVRPEDREKRERLKFPDRPGSR